MQGRWENKPGLLVNRLDLVGNKQEMFASKLEMVVRIRQGMMGRMQVMKERSHQGRLERRDEGKTWRLETSALAKT